MSVSYRSAMPRDILSEQQQNIEFVKTVEKYPCLYNSSLPTYTRKDVCDLAWEEVAEAMNMSAPACRERWRNLRAVFMRTIKQAIGGNKKKPYYLADVMKFVIPFLQPLHMSEADKQKMHNMDLVLGKPVDRDSPPSLEIDDIKIESLDEDSVSNHDWTETLNPRKRIQEEETPVSSKRPANDNNISMQSTSSRLIESNDHVASFVNSLMPELREMNSAQFKSFKRRVLVLIDDIVAQIPGTPNDSDYCVGYNL